MIYQNIVRMAKKKKMSLTEIEEKANIGKGIISKWKHGCNPTFNKLQAVADVLGCKVEQLLKDQVK